MDEHDRHGERNDGRQREASNSKHGDREDDLSRRRAEQAERGERVLTRREREERWPIG
jgi:hypothetical protein